MKRRTLTLMPLIGATYFMVAGGPYGLEELVQDGGYRAAALILLFTPVLWSLPIALMVGELSSAIPEDGGYYAWVRRALGPFWGFQEAWLSIVASVFDMAIYPTLFVLYLSRLWPAAAGPSGTVIEVAMIAACTAWNLRDSAAVGKSSVALTLVLLAPFAALVFLGFRASAAASSTSVLHHDLLGGVLIAMWNYMGWDNASTVAGEVKNPQRAYPVAMIASVALVALSYLLPVLAIGYAGINTDGWATGAWVEAATQLGGQTLGALVVVGGMVSAVGMFNALVLSYSRVPMALAEDGMLPKAFARKLPKTGAPWLSVLACAFAWTVSLGLSFERLILLDVMLYGLSLVLEFAALVALRIREPDLSRPFRVPGKIVGAIAIGIPPAALIAAALVRSRNERLGNISGLTLGLVLILAGPVLYVIAKKSTRTATP